MSAIVNVIGREILDSRGYPTVECDILLESGVIGRASVPSGASLSFKEAIELRDNDKNRYFGRGVLQACKNINTEISEAIMGLEVKEQTFLDQTLINLDGTKSKSRLGSNSILAVSLAAARAAAKECGLPLYRYFGGSGPIYMPIPMINIINGGIHADNNLNLQEFMIVPVGASSFKEAVQWGSEVFHTLKNLLKQQGLSTSVGDEGGFSPSFQNHELVIQLILRAIKKAGYNPETQILLALDCAANEYFQDGFYHLKNENKILSFMQKVEFLSDLCKKYPIISIEDGMAETDFDGWKLLTNKLGHKIQLVGDDLFATNVKFLKEGINKKIANSILIKINQIGTLTETFSTIETAKCFGYTTIISHRSGETEDSSIADIAVGLNTLHIKIGSMSRSDRIIKYNQLLRIEEDLGKNSKYPNFDAFYNLKIK